MDTNKYDAVVVGAGPNGLSAAITLQRAGLSVLLLEAKNTIGGGARTMELTLPGFKHDICSAIHPLGAGSPFFQTLPLHQYGLEYIYPPLAAAHPFDDGSAAVLHQSVMETAGLLGSDEQKYIDLLQPIVRDWPILAPKILGPLQWPSNPLAMAKFGLKGLTSATKLAAGFSTEKTKGLFAGMAAHSIQPLSNMATSAIALVLLATGHIRGWPVAKGGSQAIVDALAAHFKYLGGKIQTGVNVQSMDQLPKANVVLFDITPRQLVKIAGQQLSSLYKWQLSRFKYGMGVFKIDWALGAPIPFTNPECRRAGTIHLGSTFSEIADYEAAAFKGQIGNKPYVLLAQQSIFDSSRAPTGQHTAWAYCHVPFGSIQNMTPLIEDQVERYAPGFRQTILARHCLNAVQMEQYNANYVGGDINGGVLDITQLFTRPVLRPSPYQTSTKAIYLCSSSTPPGGGVHGMCGYYAAKKALKAVFNLTETIGLTNG